MITVGYIGLGLMGKSMACNLLKAGFPVVVYNRSRAAVDELVAQGAFAAKSPAELARKVKVVLTNLPDTPDVLDVVLGENGIIQGVRHGLIYIDNSTIKPDAAREIARKLEPLGVSSLDAPVSGGDIGAREGTLTIMVGGPKEAFESAMPVLQAMGKTITYIGEAGAGQIAKAANQIMVSAQMVAMGELLIFAQKCGTDPRKVVEAVKAGSAQCWALDVKPQRLFAGNREPGFKAKLQAKDLGIVMETARAYGVTLPGTAISNQMFQAMVASGLGEMDNSGVISVIEMLTGEKLSIEESASSKEKKGESHSKAAPSKSESDSAAKQKNTDSSTAENHKPPASSQPAIVEKPAVDVRKVAPLITPKGTDPTAASQPPKPSMEKSALPIDSPASGPAAVSVKPTQAAKMKETPPFIDIDEPVTTAQRERVRVSKNKTTPL